MCLLIGKLETSFHELYGYIYGVLFALLLGCCYAIFWVYMNVEFLCRWTLPVMRCEEIVTDCDEMDIDCDEKEAYCDEMEIDRCGIWMDTSYEPDGDS
jgi:hypothetical protein